VTAVKALGTLVELLGELHFPDLVPSLLRALNTNTSGIGYGVAQGLSEVLSGLAWNDGKTFYRPSSPVLSMSCLDFLPV
jgi:hypothetical protein